VSKKPPHTIRNFDPAEVPETNKTISVAYQAKLESINKRDTSGTGQFTYQSAEHGEVDFSGTGSPTVALSFGFVEKQNKIIYASAHALSTLVSAHVTGVTSTGLTITCRSISGTANLSDVTTSTIKVFYQVIGSNP